MVLALGILAVLMVAGQSAIRIAGHSVPSSSSPTYSAGNAQRALAQMASELAYATSVTSMSSTSVTFTVAARGADASPETIIYSWDGIVGDPLTRQYNSNAAVTLVTGVNAFSLLYDKKSVVAPTTYTTSATTSLYAYPTIAVLSSVDNVQNNLWASQSFTPVLPTGATSYSITSVSFYALQGTPAPPSGAQCLVQIRPSSGAVPSSTVYQSTTVTPNSYSALLPAWQSATFASPYSISAGQQAALTFEWVNGPGALGLKYQTLFSSGLAAATSQNQGSSWTTTNGQTIYCQIYGTYTTPNPTAMNYFLQNVRASLQLGSNSDAAVRTGIPIHNLPQVTGP